MAIYCSHCGAQLDDNAKFCNACGKTITAASGPAAGGVAASGLESNVAAALSYLVVTAIIFLVVDPYKRDPFIRFHSFQAIFYWAAWFVFFIVFNIFGFVTGFIYLLLPLFWLAAFVGWCLLAYKAYNKERFKMPIIGDLAEKQAGV